MKSSSTLTEIKQIDEEYQSKGFEADHQQFVQRFSQALQKLAKSEESYFLAAVPRNEILEKVLPISTLLETVKRHQKEEFIELCANHFKKAIAPENSREQEHTRFSKVFGNKGSRASGGFFNGGVYRMAAENAYTMLDQEYAYQPPKMPGNN